MAMMNHLEKWLMVVLLSTMYAKSECSQKITLVKAPCDVGYAVMSDVDKLLSDAPDKARALAADVKRAYLKDLKSIDDELRQQAEERLEYEKRFTFWQRNVKGIPLLAQPQIATWNDLFTSYERECSYFDLSNGEPDSFKWDEEPELLKCFTTRVAKIIIHKIAQVDDRPVTILSLEAKDLCVDLSILALVLKEYPYAQMKFFFKKQTCPLASAQFSKWFKKCYPRNNGIDVREFSVYQDVPFVDLVYARGNHNIAEGLVGKEYKWWCRHKGSKNSYSGLMLGVVSRGIVFQEDGELVPDDEPNNNPLPPPYSAGKPVSMAPATQ